MALYHSPGYSVRATTTCGFCGVTVSAGVRIGRGTVVAAGSVVTADLPPLVLAAGVPARVIRSLA